MTNKKGPAGGQHGRGNEANTGTYSAPIISQNTPPVTIKKLCWLADRIDPTTTDPDQLAALVDLADALELEVQR